MRKFATVYRCERDRTAWRRLRREEDGAQRLHASKQLLTPLPTARKKLRSWSDDSMQAAIDAVKSGRMGVNRAALEFGVPRTTLKDRIAGRVVHGTRSGPKPYLTPQEEKELADFLVSCSKMGYGKTRGEVLKIVEAIAKKKGVKVQGYISDGWWCRFRERWPQLSLRKGDPFSQVRSEMTTREVFEGFFDLLRETLEKADVIDKPAQIHNCDESGMPLEHKMPRTVAQKGTKKVRQRSSGNKTQITILGCASAAGQAIPPMVVFSGKTKSTADQGLQRREISSSECAACFGLYEDDVDEDGTVTCDWIQCTNEQCSLWMHTNCLDKSDGEYVCAVCQNIFC